MGDGGSRESLGGYQGLGAKKSIALAAGAYLNSQF